MIYFIIIFFIVLFFIINLYLKDKNKEYYIDNILFLNNDDLFEILSKNDDNYYKTFFLTDYKARNINTIEEYINYIKISVDNFSDYDKNKIEKCIKKANLFFEKIHFEWFDGKKANKIPWKIGCVSGKLYENGLPHTRLDVIIISKENIKNYTETKLINTLIHEKVHIYQKKYKNDIIIYLKNNHFVKLKEREKTDNIRSNPDLDNFIYIDSNKDVYKALYNNNPSSIEDIIYYPINNQSYEHPFEKMAIFIEDINK
jgi:hypothetical protein